MLAVVAVISGCGSGGTREYLYEALYQRHCLENVGPVDCDPRHESYQSYEQRRKEASRR